MTNVTVVIPNHNKGTLIEQTLESVLAQSSPPEIVVIDDASTDVSRDIVRRYGQGHARVKAILLDENRGGSHCRNLGLAASSGDHVMFLDSDDLLEPTCCETRLLVAERHPEHDAWIFPMRVFRDDPAETIVSSIPRCGGDLLGAFLRFRLPWSIMQPLWRRSFLESIDGFDETFKRLQDPEMHARALLAGARVKCFPDRLPDCAYRVGDTRTSLDGTAAARRDVDGSLHFYETFAARVGERLPQLSGALEAAIARLVADWRRGRITADDLSSMGGRLVSACRIRRHRTVLGAYLRFAGMIPFHPPGIGTVVRSLLR